MTLPEVPTVIQVLLGVGLLLAGRKLFWLFVGGVGFFAGFTLAQEYFPGQGGNMDLVFGVVLGIAGVALAYLAQKIALSIGGFLAGAFLGITLVKDLLGMADPVPVAVILVSGVAGLVLVHFVFDWALTILSAVAGATVISQFLPLSDNAQLVVIVLLSAVGVAVQRKTAEGKEKKRSEKEVTNKENKQHQEDTRPDNPEAK